jgi:predicted transcriptional regulator
VSVRNEQTVYAQIINICAAMASRYTDTPAGKSARDYFDTERRFVEIVQQCFENKLKTLNETSTLERVIVQ